MILYLIASDFWLIWKRKRLNFAKRHRDWTVQDWNEVLFLDESTIQQFVARKRHVRRPVGKRFDQRYTVAPMKHPTSQMIWGAMSCSGTAGLYFLPPNTTTNGPRYVDSLQEKLELHMNVHKCSIFMQEDWLLWRQQILISGSSWRTERLVTKRRWPPIFSGRRTSPYLNGLETALTSIR